MPWQRCMGGERKLVTPLHRRWSSAGWGQSGAAGLGVIASMLHGESLARTFELVPSLVALGGGRLENARRQNSVVPPTSYAEWAKMPCDEI